MNVLIIGGGGFVGSYLAEQFSESGDYSIYLTKMFHEPFMSNKFEVFDMDLLDIKCINRVLDQSKPDIIINLAAQSSVSLSWAKPALTIDVNIKGTVTLLEAVLLKKKINPRILLIGSGEEYGYINPDCVPIKEETVLRPGNIYAVTKACQSMIGRVYAKAYGMDIIMTRSFNHCGPKQPQGFVIADFCKQIVEIEKGLRAPVLNVGNLSAMRDFLDVRDTVCAYQLLVQKGKTGGEIYNVGSGKARSIQDILSEILDISGVKCEVSIDKNKLRPSDIPVIEADITKIYNDTGWQPSIPLRKTLLDILEYWRNSA